MLDYIVISLLFRHLYKIIKGPLDTYSICETTTRHTSVLPIYPTSILTRDKLSARRTHCRENRAHGRRKAFPSLYSAHAHHTVLHSLYSAEMYHIECLTSYSAVLQYGLPFTFFRADVHHIVHSALYSAYLRSLYGAISSP